MTTKPLAGIQIVSTSTTNDYVVVTRGSSLFRLPISSLATGGVDLSNYYNKSQVDNLLLSKVDSSALGSYITTGSLSSTLNGYITNSGLTTTLTSYVTSSTLSNTLSGYATTSDLTSGLSTKADISALSSYVTTEGLATSLGTYVTTTNLNNHTNNTSNPHNVTVSQIGAIAATDRGVANGVASLDSNTLVPDTQISTNIARQSALNNHTGDTNNPHGVTASQVGNTTAQWNANQLQGRPVSSTSPTSGQSLVWNGSLWVPQSVSGGGSGYVSGQAIGDTGRWYVFFDGNPSVGTTAIAADRIYLLMADIQRTINIDQIGFNVGTAGAAGTVARVGIYSSDSNFLPNTLVVEGTTVIDCTTTGAKSSALPSVTTLTPGLYWVALLANQGFTPSTIGATFSFIKYHGASSANATSAFSGRTVNQTYGALPSTLTGTALANNIPYLTLRTA